MNEDIIERLERHNWRDTILMLNAYVLGLCRYNKINPDDIDPEDIVMDAIEKVYNGTRKWNPDNDPDLHKYLMSVTKSLLNNELNKSHYKNDSLDSCTEENFSSSRDHVFNEVYYRELNEKVSTAMRGDPELCLVFKALKDGLRPAEIAEEYALAIEVIRNAQKRLNRLVQKVINSLTKSTSE